MPQVLAAILTSLITGIVLWYSEIQSNKRQKKNISGKYVLRASVIYKITGIVTTIIGLTFTNLMILNWNDDIQIIAPLVSGMFLIPGIAITMFYYNYRVEFDDTRITVTNWKATKKTFHWHQLSKVRYLGSLKCLYLKSSTHSTYINQDSVGFINFMEMLESQTNYTAETLKIK